MRTRTSRGIFRVYHASLTKSPSPLLLFFLSLAFSRPVRKCTLSVAKGIDGDINS